MALLNDYFYRFPDDQQHNMPGRCRVRIYKRKNGMHAVLLTELDSNAGEPITSACERIATGLVATKGLSPKTTRWIQHDPAYDAQSERFDELSFTWDVTNRASDPQWQRVSAEQVESLTGDSLRDLSRRLGDRGIQAEEEPKHDETEAEGTT